MDQQSPSQYDNEKIKGEIIDLLESKDAILMVGAGSSSFVGYPRWKKLVIELKEKFYPEYSDPSDESDLSGYAQIIKDRIIQDNRQDDYNQFIFEKFQPYPPNINKENYTPFHISLVNLGFCGIVTTNYDKVLEIALQASPNKYGNVPNCESLDLCGEKPYSVFPFLRSLRPGTKHANILHLHGWYQNPEKIILTLNDYQENYGLLDENDQKAKRILDTFHRKVIWTLLTTHPLLFVGFSLTDPFFLEMITIVKADFKLQDKSIHYAIMGYHNPEEIFKTAEQLSHFGICPVFYKIDVKSDGTEDYTRLSDLIFEMEEILSSRQMRSEIFIKKPEFEQKIEKYHSTIFPSLNEMNKITGGI